MFCWKGSWKIYFIYFATVYVKLKELNFIIGKVKTSKVVLEQGRRCLQRNELKTKTQFLLSNWFKMSKTNKYLNNALYGAKLLLTVMLMYSSRKHLSESPNHKKYWENILISRFYEQFSRSSRNLGHFGSSKKLQTLRTQTYHFSFEAGDLEIPNIQFV